MKNRQTLADALIEALKSVPSEVVNFFSAISKFEEELERRANPQSPDDIGYEYIQSLNELGVGSEFLLSSQIDFYTRSIRVENPAAKSKLLDAIKSWVDEFMDDSKIMVGGQFTSYTVEDILKGLIRTTITKGPEEATATFCDCVEKQAIVFHEYFLLEGIQIKEQVDILEGVSLIPLPARSAVLPGDFFERAEAFRRVPGSKTLLRVDRRISPAMHKPSIREPQELQDQQHQAGFKSEKLAWALTMAGSGPVQIVMAWDHLPYDHPLKLSRFGRMGRRAVYLVIGYRMAKEFSERQINEAKGIYEKLAQLDDEVLDYLEVPIKRWIASKAGYHTVDRFIDLGIALESFYLHGIKQRSELLFRVGLRAALHLGGDSGCRKELAEKFWRVYRLRSEAVHEGKLDNDESASKALEKVQDLFKDSLGIIIDSNKIPGWKEIELGVQTSTED